MDAAQQIGYNWKRPAFLRRIILSTLILVPTYIATGYMAYVLPRGGSTLLEITVLVMFAVLYAWISVGFWTAMVGLVVLVRGRDEWAISSAVRMKRAYGPGPGPEARTAIVMPIYNEDVSRVTAGISSIVESLIETGRGGLFDFFILSDPGDPDIWIQEEIGWANLLSRFSDGPVAIYYRRRTGNAKRKSGNVADFCRRWGKNYRYMIVLDADSIMDGKTMLDMVRIMENREQIGILQTAPRPVNRETPIARMQQFASSLYGSLFAAGLNFWQLGDSQFWGHNAIIRIEPFMRHCALPRLSGKPPLGGDILSHDFVEAALMRRSGYEVWLAYDLEGTYEEPPPTLLDELKRDRRWCQGNMQHLRLVFARGLYGAHRVLFLNGAMSYGSALLWFLFLAASSIMAIAQNLREPDYFPTGKSLFPSWPVWEPQWAFVLLASTAIILFLPKLCSILYVLLHRRGRLFGGPWSILASFLMEVIFSTLLAPTRMLFHAKFVFMTLLGRQISWEAQQRRDVGTGWGEAIRFHWGATVFSIAWGLVLFIANRAFFWWLSPILISLVVSIPLSVWTSRPSVGIVMKRFRLFLTPEESSPPPGIERLQKPKQENGESRFSLMRNQSEDEGFIRAVVDPKIYTLHIGMTAKRRLPSPAAAARRRKLCEKALDMGPQLLSSMEKLDILSDPSSMADLHRKVWELTAEDRIAAWRLP